MVDRKIGIAIISLSVLVIMLLTGVLIGIYLAPERVIEIEKTPNHNITNSIYKTMPIVGVDSKGNGLTAEMIVEVKPGTGLVLVNINDLLADYQTQISARTAAKISSNFTGVNLTDLDVIYNIKANATIIEGPSAGVAMTLGTIAALQNKTVNKSIFITGTIEEDGSVGTVGGVGEKAKAAKENNATLFLIPDAIYSVGYDEVKECIQLENNINYCEIAYIPRKTDLSVLLELEIVSVKNITEAADYILI